MPLGRANTVSRSRTPTAPPSPRPMGTSLPPSPRPPTFLPPAHYAAAAGFKYPLDRNPRSSSIDSESSMSDSARRNFENSRDTQITRAERRFTIMAPKSKTPEPREKNKRETQILNLPMVETQLLPSLRDTITKMTQVPAVPTQTPARTQPTLSVRTPSRSASPRSTTPKPTTPSHPFTTPETPKTKGTPKPVLKSALKAPTPKLLSLSPRLDPPLPAPTSNTTLRSVRSLLKRKDLTTAANIDSHIPVPAGRARSRTDPGTMPSSKSPAIQAAFPSTPQPAHTRPFVSSIPRRRFGDSTDSSDPESQFEAAARRRLIVANAEIFASSSSSSSDSDLDGRLPTPSGTPVLGRFRGLGIGMADGVKERPSSAVSCLSSESEYDDDEEEEEERTGDSVDLSGDEAHRRRKMALLDIVGGLHLDLGDRESEYESEYNGVQGVAVGGSDESEYESDNRHSRPSPPSVYVSDSSDYTQVASPGPRTPRPQQYEAIELAQTSHFTAVQQRQAFGIPPSESDQVGTQDILSHADSILSEMGETGKEIWRDDLEPGEFSEGAEKLFRSLSGSVTRDSFPRRRPPVDKPYSNGPMLTPTREDVFAAFQDSEAAFVARLTQTVRMFVLPLRVQDTKLWIEGVPLVIGRVLDWLEDILNLHALVLDELRHQDVDAEALRAMGLPRRMEVYAPYLVRLAEGVEGLRQNVDDPENDYGEFVRMQEAQLRDENRGEGWTLERLLVEPVDRLGLYPRIFKQLLDTTPKTHVDYLPTLCLLRSVEWIIAAMTEVKVREDDYEHIKGLVANIRGLPADIAVRDRKLLHQGRAYLTAASELSAQSLTFTNAKARDRSSRLVTAIRDWDVRRSSMRTGSTTTAESVSSWEAPPTPTPTPKRTLVDVFVFEDVLFFGKPTMEGTWTFCEELGLMRVLEWEFDGQDIKLELLPVLDMRSYSLGAMPRDVGMRVVELRMAEDDAGEWKEALKVVKKKTEVFIARPDGMDYDEKRLQRQYVGELLGAGLPVPKSPSMQMEIDLRIETEREEREERGWWSLRLREIMRDMSARG